MSAATPLTAEERSLREFASNLVFAQTLWRRYPDLVESETLEEPFAAAFRAEHEAEADHRSEIAGETELVEAGILPNPNQLTYNRRAVQEKLKKQVILSGLVESLREYVRHATLEDLGLFAAILDQHEGKDAIGVLNEILVCPAHQTGHEADQQDEDCPHSEQITQMSKEPKECAPIETALNAPTIGRPAWEEYPKLGAALCGYYDGARDSIDLSRGEYIEAKVFVAGLRGCSVPVEKDDQHPLPEWLSHTPEAPNTTDSASTTASMNWRRTCRSNSPSPCCASSITSAVANVSCNGSSFSLAQLRNPSTAWPLPI